ncbi:MULTISPECIES: aspartyl/asparaginyl beta-hydroxylase domain-containing protein [Streptomyces]|uniref:Aspartyl/asparaginyl beta-hydroxylase domain-containing protein n=1 Tax=Streptomyces koelreuteriae TaxID=2838015 RepID=A0ABX8FJF0_9ACTN|nr:MULTISPECIES: aspartyl/asparaginyl beta-hydroxylase domain-containing protein [Streptomyces]QWB21210.1 aspartyl/asparaginyl beta-hydroxylase domain-containing protein [Streptomyces koelreuteriae]UUA04126.1 aspartyl/asparaginyl beta-hydroxylase domain-containing protein [Streptomyces koelreuteriae]UUA11752.1 aspartyl/asparaginyl beta-hydroxylase domain-containing protein [Streptomyces sp. CRCS-T-1]
MTPEIENAFAAVRAEFGAESITRVERMLQPGGVERHPLQKAAKWIMPGLSPTPWHDPYAHAELAPVVRELEAHHRTIKKELLSAWEERREAFADYEHYLTRQENWQALYLYRDGGLVEESAIAAPTAYRVLKDVAVDTGKICPLLESHFSTLLPGAFIEPHCDLWNFSINLHLAVDIPEGCRITVAGETRSWEEGKCLLFDYSFEHEARNDGTRPRTCLLIDLWHPETTLPERRALVALITEIRRLMGESGGDR